MRLYAVRDLSRVPAKDADTLLHFLLQEVHQLESHLHLLEEYKKTHNNLLKYTRDNQLTTDTGFLTHNINRLNIISDIEKHKLTIEKNNFNYIKDKINLQRLNRGTASIFDKEPHLQLPNFEHMDDVIYEAAKTFKPFILKRQLVTPSTTLASVERKVRRQRLFNLFRKTLVKILKIRGRRILFRFFKSLILA